MKQTRFIADLQHLHPMLQWLRGQIETLSLPSSWLKEWELSLEEALVNIIRYAYPEVEEGEIEIALEATPEWICVTLKDQGKKFNPLAHVATTSFQSLDEVKKGGFGILLMQKHVDQLLYIYEEGSNVLTLMKQIPTH